MDFGIDILMFMLGITEPILVILLQIESYIIEILYELCLFLYSHEIGTNRELVLVCYTLWKLTNYVSLLTTHKLLYPRKFLDVYFKLLLKSIWIFT